MSKLKFDTWENPDGTENFKCRAWVNFNGTGTVAIRAAGNVTSITDNDIGDYIVNFENDMPDVNYGISTGGSQTGTVINNDRFISAFAETISTVRVVFNARIGSTPSPSDATVICITVFR